ncbi:MAG: hypothetical protein IBJ03_02370 [Gemmatimonadaceae bacterium]|nr:hypothetical protein [Gemmatimonadaceae bacterium]
MLSSALIVGCTDRTRDTTRAPVTGTYAWKGAAESGCVLKVAEQASDSAQVRFDCTRGAPSYNSGMAEGVVVLVDNQAALSITEYGNPCTLSLQFSRDTIVVVQTGSDADCGFGYGVSADGRYARTTSARPDFERDR